MKNNAFKRYWATPLEISWPMATFGPRGPSKRGAQWPGRGFGPRPLWPSSAEEKGTRRRRDYAAARLGQRPAAISGHGRASKRAHGMREKTASVVG